MDGPTGKVCLNLKPTKKLVIKVEKKDGSGSSSSSSENFVAEKDGKFVIPVPGPCKWRYWKARSNMLALLISFVPF